MGMFDYVNYESTCPQCKGKCEGFQSKDAKCEMELLEVDAVDNFYTSCSKCHGFVEYYRIDELNWKRTFEVKLKVLSEYTETVRIGEKK